LACFHLCAKKGHG